MGQSLKVIECSYRRFVVRARLPSGRYATGILTEAWNGASVFVDKRNPDKLYNLTADCRFVPCRL